MSMYSLNTLNMILSQKIDIIGNIRFKKIEIY